MAIVRSAGTEIIRSAHFEDVTDTAEVLIVGEQHHIYTVLSIVAYCNGQTGSETGFVALRAYDTNVGETAQWINIAKVVATTGQTWVWNDKFSFNGHEPTDFTGPLTVNATGVTNQNAIADQGSAVIQYLYFLGGSSNTTFDVTVTYIDQNNA